MTDTECAADRPLRLAVIIWLSVAACLAGFGQITVALLAGIIGAGLAPAPGLATLPMAAGVIGIAVAAWPVAPARRRYGDRLVYTVLLLWALLGGGVAALSVSNGWFSGFILACFMLGNNTAAVAQYRFTASCLVPEKKINVAVSCIMVATLAAAVAAPELALAGRFLMAGEFAGSFAALCAVFAVAALIMVFLPLDGRELPSPATAAKTRLAGVLADPQIQLAMIAAVAGYGVMTLIMTATPISMHVIEGHSAEVTADTIRAHILAMFAPSLFSGWLIGRLGVHRVLWCGVGLQLACVIIALYSQEANYYFAALIALGAGWNFLFVGGTTLLATAADSNNRKHVEAVNEFLVFGTMAVTSLSAGGALYALGWAGTNLAALAILGLVAAALLRSKRRGN